MAPLKKYSKWNQRAADSKEPIEPYRKYYIICEGKNTEKWYFEKLIDSRKELSIVSPIDLVFLEKTEEHESWSNPKNLFDLSNSVVKESTFDKKHDKVVIVFDVDIYEQQESFNTYLELIGNTTEYQIVAITNPSFELFLLLHFQNSFKEIIFPNSATIIANSKTLYEGERIRFVEKLLRQKTGLKPKKDKQIGDLALNIRTAVEQEPNINNNIHDCKGKLSSNIALVLSVLFKQSDDEQPSEAVESIQ